MRVKALLLYLHLFLLRIELVAEMLVLEPDRVMCLQLLIIEVFVHLKGRFLLVAGGGKRYHDRRVLPIIECRVALQALVVKFLVVFFDISSDFWKLRTVFRDVAFFLANEAFDQQNLKILLIC